MAIKKSRDIWENVGGGTCLNGKSDAKGYPSDDTYRHQRYGHEMTVYATTERYFMLPRTVKSMKDILKLEGVSGQFHVSPSLYLNTGMPLWKQLCHLMEEMKLVGWGK